MPPAAPRIDSRLVAAAARFDKPSRAIADTHRAVGVVAEHLGLSRPSYQQVRVIVHQLRERRRDPSIGKVLLDIAFRVKPPTALIEALELRG